MTSTYTYRAYWREQGATAWNLIESSSPITWNHVVTQPQQSQPLPYTGGQCQKLYRVRGEWRTTWFFNCSTGASGGIGSWLSFETEFNVPGPLGGITVTRRTPACGGFDGHTVLIGTPQGPRIIFNRDGTGVINRGVEVRIIGVDAADSNDNCGNLPGYGDTAASCTTTFSTGLIISRPQCIEVTLSPPECPCCKELLPKANAILARLG